MSLLVDAYNSVIEQANQTIVELLDTKGGPAPHRHGTFLDVTRFELVIDGKLITHINDDIALDEDGLEYHLYCFSSNGTINEFLSALDSLSDGE